MTGQEDQSQDVVLDVVDLLVGRRHRYLPSDGVTDLLGGVIRPGVWRHDPSVGSLAGTSGGSSIWRRVAMTVASGHYLACSSANSR